MATQKTQRAANFAQAAVYTLIIVAILGVVNFLAQRYNKSFDATANKKYTLSDQTAKVVKNIQGDLTVEAGAKLTGSVRANSVTVAGEIEGNIDSAVRVELLETGVLNGDLKAGTLTVVSGSRMRGRVEFGWSEEITLGTSLSA